MNVFKHLWTFLFLLSLMVAVQPLQGAAQSNSGATSAILQQKSKERDGQHDFDFNIGSWKTHIRLLQNPLTGSTAWVELNGTVVVRKVWNGRAQMEEIEADGPTGHFEGLTLFLYNPQSHQWSQNFASGSDGTFGPPSIGEFRNERGEFFQSGDGQRQKHPGERSLGRNHSEFAPL
jgi:hypothetical protein